VQTLRLARLGQTMETGRIERWLKREGDAIAVGDVLYEVQTEKATVDVEATAAGTLARIVAAEGDELPVGALVAVVADPGEQPTDADIDRAVAEAAGATPAPAEATPEPVAVAAAPTTDRIRIMPRARALAERAGIGLEALAGTGPGGAITVADIERATDTGGPRVLERRRLDGRARAMADAVTRSVREIPQFFQQVTVMADGLQRRRREAARPVTYTDVLIAACARAVADCPTANAMFAGNEVVVYEDVNVGVAVATPGGLVVPVLRRAQTLGLEEIAAATDELVARARDGKLGPDDLSGGTITVSNLGMRGIEQGAAIITPPQAAIVFAGAIVERPVVRDGRVDVAACFQLSVTFDHRVLDGASAAEFTASLRRHLEDD
jgi:pyruvate dehydrogenase E2 component (dihydrolipoamide acetyltransferase)